MEQLHPKVLKVQQQPRIEQRSPAWYDIRGRLLTASDVAAALGIKPFETYTGDARKDLIRKKAEQAIGIVKFQGNDATRHGQEYEPECIRLYEQQTATKVLDFGLLIHPEHPWLGGSPDGIVASTAVLIEAKCPLMRKIVKDHIPEHYYPQVQLCLEVADLEEAHFIELKPSCVTWPLEPQFQITVVHRNREWFREALPKLKAVFDEIQQARAKAKATGELPYPPPPEQPSKKRAKRLPLCLIRDELYGPIPMPFKKSSVCMFQKCSFI